MEKDDSELIEKTLKSGDTILTKQNEKVSTFDRRLREAMGSMSYQELANALKMTKQAVGTWVNGNRTPKTPTIKTIAQFLNVDVDWLCGFDVPKRYNAPRLLYSNRIPAIPVIPWSDIINFSDKIGSVDSKNFIYYDLEDPEKHESFFTKVIGTEMKDYGIVEGSFVLIHRQNDLYNGYIFLCSFNDNIVHLRKVNIENSYVTFIPGDLRKPSKTFELYELSARNNVQIIGAVRAVINKLEK